MEKRLGKIASVSFGCGGYQGARLGIHLTLEGQGWGVGTGKDAWDYRKIECSPHAKWTEDDRSKSYAEIMRYVSGILSDAKVSTVDDLKGIPVEATFDGMMLKEWRVLTEVL